VHVAPVATAVGGSALSLTHTTHVGDAAVPASVHVWFVVELSAWLLLTHIRLSVVLSMAAAPATDAFASAHVVPLSLSLPSVLRT
jgi:hypothetical protein